MRPSQVAALRRELLEWLDTADAAAYYELMGDDPGTWTQTAQSAALAQASLFFVSDGMTAVAAHASQSMPDQVPLRDEFPAECGFAAWDGPLVHADVVAQLVEAHPTAELLSTCHVLSWKLTQVHAFDHEYRDHETHDQADVHAGEHDQSGHSEGDLIDVAMLTFWVRPEGRTYPPLIPYHSAVLDLSLLIRGSAREDNEGGNELAGAWIEHFDMAVYTTLVLMGQTVAVVTEERPERAERRRTERAGLDVRDVRVVQLRRAENATGGKGDGLGQDPAGGDEEPGDAKSQVAWSRRWVVRGHWRQQWYPSLNDHRSVWVHSYVKGPGELPLITDTTDVVHALTR